MAKDLVTEISRGNVKVLRAGTEQETERGFYAPASIVLVKGNYPCIVDTGCFGEESRIHSLIKKEGLSPRDIKRVFITHNHPDHLGNVGLFNQSRVYFPDSIQDVAHPNYFELMPEGFYFPESGKSLDINPNLKILSTPGHAGWDFSVLYKGRDGRVLVAGDLFWSEEDWKNDSEFLGLCVHPFMQKVSREYIRKKLKPEVIIPGHGEAFAPRY